MKGILTLATTFFLANPLFAQESKTASADMHKNMKNTRMDKGSMDSDSSNQEISDDASMYTCKSEANVRKIEIKTMDPASDPGGNKCQVEYTKETEDPGNVQTLWTAKSSTDYCNEKAAGLATKLEGWGWKCVSQ